MASVSDEGKTDERGDEEAKSRELRTKKGSPSAISNDGRIRDASGEDLPPIAGDFVANCRVLAVLGAA
jgi:hypothetical protein